MLVLTRKPGEKIVVGDDIVVTLISIRRDDTYGDRVRIGLEAPSDVPIRREEVPDLRKADQSVLDESTLDSLQGESRQLRQKVDALECQIRREHRGTSPEVERVGELCSVLLSLRGRCNELLDQLSKGCPADDPPKGPQSHDRAS